MSDALLPRVIAGAPATKQSTLALPPDGLLRFARNDDLNGEDPPDAISPTRPQRPEDFAGLPRHRGGCSAGRPTRRRRRGSWPSARPDKFHRQCQRLWSSHSDGGPRDLERQGQLGAGDEPPTSSATIPIAAGCHRAGCCSGRGKPEAARHRLHQRLLICIRKTIQRRWKPCARWAT